MNATDPTLANILQVAGNIEHYHIPKYQREYTWGRNEWEQLLIDIEENDIGYFMGSIICITDNAELGPGESPIFEVVDGQQRLITISIFLLSVYCRLLALKENFSLEDEDEKDEYKSLLSNIRKQLVHKKSTINKTESGYFKDKSKKKYCFLRVQPSTQNSNLNDYLQILNELEIIKGNFKSKFCGVRRLYKAYNYFYSNISEDYEEIKKILHKINSLKFIHISVTSSSDAFVLFESLNNRGVPLSAMDIIKNKILAQLEKQHKIDIDEAYEDWQRLLGFIPEYKDQERFLRQYYNAFKIYSDIKIDKFTRATKSNLIKIYEIFIKTNAKKTIDSLLKKAEIYNTFIEPNSNELPEIRKKHLLDLGRIGSAPSYLFLLYLCSLPKNIFGNNKESVIDEILSFFVKYYVRRNITDFPNTRDLDSINMDVIRKCDRRLKKGNKLKSQFIIKKFLDGKGKPSPIKDLKNKLEDNLFYYNSGMARFVLSKIDEISHSKEYRPDLWARNEKGLLVWTVEHILPQGENIPQYWIDMIADGDKKKAEEIHKERVHCLGNLTLSGYNSKLHNARFEDKQNLHENKKFLGHKIDIGYKNNLSLNNFQFIMNNENTSLAKIDKWTERSIIARNNAMVNVLLKLFAFDEEEIKELDKEKVNNGTSV